MSFYNLDLITDVLQMNILTKTITPNKMIKFHLTSLLFKTYLLKHSHNLVYNDLKQLFLSILFSKFDVWCVNGCKNQSEHKESGCRPATSAPQKQSLYTENEEGVQTPAKTLYICDKYWTICL